MSSLRNKREDRMEACYDIDRLVARIAMIVVIAALLSCVVNPWHTQNLENVLKMLGSDIRATPGHVWGFWLPIIAYLALLGALNVTQTFHPRRTAAVKRHPSLWTQYWIGSHITRWAHWGLSLRRSWPWIGLISARWIFARPGPSLRPNPYVTHEIHQDSCIRWAIFILSTRDPAFLEREAPKWRARDLLRPGAHQGAHTDIACALLDAKVVSEGEIMDFMMSANNVLRKRAVLAIGSAA